MAEEKDLLLEQFAEMRKYVEFSHKELSEKVALTATAADLKATRADLGRLERKVDARFDVTDSRFDRLERKIDALAVRRRAPRDRRKP